MRKRIFRRRGRRGITLVELLVAALILAVSLMGLLNVFMFSSAMTRSSDEKAIATGIGRSCLETVRAGGSHYWHPSMVAAGYLVQSLGLYLREYDVDGTAVQNGGVYRVVCELARTNASPQHLWKDMVTIEVQRTSDDAVLFTSRTYLVLGGI